MNAAKLGKAVWALGDEVRKHTDDPHEAVTMLLVAAVFEAGSAKPDDVTWTAFNQNLKTMLCEAVDTTCAVLPKHQPNG